ncbi:2Fe-2S iron-sulfur cluster-binding protein [Halocatena pleomorpha]|uniref:Ferredoxin n=1 Tax=Halocatena pleomorpha TaxID=1785090 RepID=A0A3P3RG94_9EURY|nr:2Fe-2S iron-sulfur cluster-binding protein [Halocatena pleomorpha]RRJ31453.1 ferredoxin [Halocatena pleomorpha]
MTTYEIVLEWQDGRTESIRVEADETVLEVAERAGLGLPYGCLTGACATCTGRLTAGDLAYRRSPRALKKHQQRNGYVLLCIAEPRSDCHIDVGSRIQAEMMSNPLK